MAFPDHLFDWQQCTPSPSPLQLPSSALSSASSSPSPSIKCGPGSGGDDDDDEVNKADTKDCHHPPAVSPFIDKEQIISQFPTVVSFFASNFVYLVTLLSLRTLHQNRHSNRAKRKPHHRRRLADDVLYGTVSAIVSVLVTTPLWVARSRLNNSKQPKNNKNAQNSKSTKQILGEVNMLKELMNIKENKGVGALWEGFQSSLLVASINSPVQTLVYEALRRSFARRCGACADSAHEANASLCHLATLISMMVISRCTAVTLTYPLSRAQKSKEEEKKGDSGERDDGTEKDDGKRPLSLLTTLQGIITSEGASGLFKGVQTKLLQTSLLTGLLAFTNPRIVLYILKLYRARTQKIS